MLTINDYGLEVLTKTTGLYQVPKVKILNLKNLIINTVFTKNRINLSLISAFQFRKFNGFNFSDI